MHHPMTRVEQFVHIADYWMIKDETSFYANIDGENVDMSDAEMNADHPYFSVALRGLFKKQQDHVWMKRTVISQHVWDTLCVLQHGCIELTDLNGKMHTFVNVTALTEADAVAIAQTAYAIAGNAIKLGYVEHNGTMVPYAWDTIPRDIVVTKSTLDEQYPGWHQRMALGPSLGLAIDESWRLVFSKPDKALSIPALDMTFD